MYKCGIGLRTIKGVSVCFAKIKIIREQSERKREKEINFRFLYSIEAML